MTFANWSIYNNGLNGYQENPAAGITQSYFHGRKALVFSGDQGHGMDAGGITASANALRTDLPHGLLHGKLRTLINPVLSGPANHGLLCLQSALNMQGGQSAQGYALMLDSLFFDNKVVLARMNDGIAPSIGGALGSTYTLLGQSSRGVWEENHVYSLEIEWHVETLLGGVHLIGRFGTQADFSDLAVIAESVDATSHASLTSVGEGVYANLSTNALIVAFTNILLVQQTPL
jgi:hypothetical protein